MLRALAAWSLSYRLLVLALSIVTAALGAWAFSTLPVDAYPDIAQTQVKIILKAPGMTPEEVETRIIAPIELEMLGLPRQSVLRSTAKYAIADVTIDFDEGTDIYWARQQVTERLAGVMKDMPESVSGGLAPISTPLSEVFMFTIEGPLTLAEKRELLDWTIRPALRTVPGVADVNVLGGHVRTYEVRPDPVRMAAAGLTIAAVAEAVERGNRNDGAGRLSRGDEALIVRAVGAIRDADDLRQMVVVARNDRIVRLGDIAMIGAGSQTRYGGLTRNGREAVEGLVLALRGADARKVVEGVEARLEELKPGLPKSATIDVFYNRSDLIEHAVGTVQEALIEAIVLVVILLVIFLGDWRAAAIVAATLPMAALITFLAMRYMGMSANLMSLGGLAIAIGMLVDGAVVVVENVVDRLAHARDEGVPRLNVVFRATAEVVVPVSAGLLIIALVFVPLLSLQGLEGKLFAPVALTIMFSLAAALLLALTLVPVLASFGLTSGQHREPWIMRMLAPRYHRLLAGAFARKPLVYGVAGAGLVLAVLAYGAVGKTFMPVMDEGAVVMQTAKLPSIGLARTLALDGKVEDAIIAAVPEVERIVARNGVDEIGLDAMGLNETDMFMALKPREAWRGTKEDIVDGIRTVMEGMPGIEPVFTQPIEMRVSEMLTGSRGDLAIKIFGPDLATLSSLAGRIEGILRGVRGASEVVTAANSSVDYLQLDVDRAAAGRFGMPVDSFQDMLRAQVEGLPAGTVIEAQKRIPVLIKGGDAVREDPARFRDLQMVTPSGTVARVSDLARVTETQGPVMLSHESGGRYALVQAFVSGRDLVGFVEEAKAKVEAEVKLPDGYRLVWGGQFENQQRAAARLMLVVPIALLMIFFVLFATLKSLRGALLILANIPFAAVGGIVSLWISGDFLSVPASVGFIALLGIAVLNGLVLVSYFRQLREEGVPLADAVRLGAERRLRPVLMTASITAFGLVPLLFATGPGSEIQKPLAIVVIGGLVSSTLLTLVLLPLLYERFGESRKEQAA
ncbi:CusA/CzcA family heavy metal efflux RND transporter [Sphingomonas sp. BK235]|uniref:efflux RND transporter permease subunit n=1 Tax=Sphingomonas sp. BK235 TaxID=2512131 RepID=UPI00104D46AE|nr:CusA/CzcA family heavy metal efflux RND transporter [Sphingomonas sp. BK235]TCP31002.1 cobalt-zinc-cadmium resistance protein CzcA [Sphingomonas sp. BK235]